MTSSSKKSFAGIGMMSAVVLVFGIVGFVIYTNAKKQDKPAVVAPVPVVVFENILSEITVLAKEAFPEEAITERGPISIEEKGDVTGDGVSEAFIDLGTGGASVSMLSLVRVENGQPVIAKMKDIDGVIRPLLLVQGASVMHQEQVGMSSVDRMIYQLRTFISGETGETSSCTFEAYLWDARANLFAYNPDASLSLQASYCIPQ